MGNKKTYAIDMDGILCEESKPYKSCSPIYKNIAKADKLKEAGHKIIIFTARRQCDRKTTLKWLRLYGPKFDKLICGKPKFDVYVDEMGKVKVW